jgi:tetratricopeptide (TPR) repeat protein
VRSSPRILLAAVATGCLISAAPPGVLSETFIWVDEVGVTHLTDDPDAVPESLRQDTPKEVDELRSLWSDGLYGPVPVTPPGSSGRESDRVQRLLRGAVDDLRRGENARAAATLRSVARFDPQAAEAYWYLALLDRQRGRYARAQKNLETFLELSGPHLEPWRQSARRRLASLADEQRLADLSTDHGALELVQTEGPNFRVEFDAKLGEVDPHYATTVMEYLEQARSDVSRQIGVMPLEPLGVVLYGKAAYLRAHRHRFSFQTVGFFDGRIHVTSPAHPSGSLRSLLFHEYTHAVFREQTGGDRPYWLNEGLAERIERGSRRLGASTRSERMSLKTRIMAGLWIPLRRLAPSFSGLSDEDARAAYLQSVVAAAWIDERTTREQRARMLRRIGEGFSADQALHEALGLDTEGVDAAVQQAILSEFPSMGS